MLKEGALQVFELRRGKFKKLKSAYLPEVGLGLTLWRGEYETKEDTYLRWCDREGNLLPTGNELAERAAERAAEEAEARQEAERRAEKLAAKLRELGLNPDQI